MDQIVPFFEEARVPVETIELPDPQVEGLSPDEYEVISQKVSYRLAQRPGSYVILKYLRSVAKRVDSQAVNCSPAPVGVIDGSRADVSFVVGLLVDKFAYHLPLYRQHQRLQDSGIDVSRPWLTQLSQRSISLLEPIYDAQFDSIRASRVKAMDETPIKAGRKERGKMKIGYFWPVYGEKNEVCFPFFPSRDGDNVERALGVGHAPGSVILTDGYAAYASYAKKVGIAHALCWSHSRREFVEAQSTEPLSVIEALRRISALYAIEDDIRRLALAGEAKTLHRLTRCRQDTQPAARLGRQSVLGSPVQNPEIPTGLPGALRLDRGRPCALSRVLSVVQHRSPPFRHSSDDARVCALRKGAALTRRRAITLDAAFAAHPIRFKGLSPKPPELPTAAWINPPKKDSPPTLTTSTCTLIS